MVKKNTVGKDTTDKRPRRLAKNIKSPLLMSRSARTVNTVVQSAICVMD